MFPSLREKVNTVVVENKIVKKFEIRPGKLLRFHQIHLEHLRTALERIEEYIGGVCRTGFQMGGNKIWLGATKRQRDEDAYRMRISRGVNKNYKTLARAKYTDWELHVSN